MYITIVNPVFTSLAFSMNGKRIVVSSYDSVEEEERLVELFALKVDYTTNKITEKYAQSKKVRSDSMQLIKNLEFLEAKQKPKKVVSLCLVGGVLSIIDLMDKDFDTYVKDEVMDETHLVDIAFDSNRLCLLFRENRIKMITTKQ